jgi:hypothetical protein
MWWCSMLCCSENILYPKQTLELILEFYARQCTASFSLLNIQIIFGKSFTLILAFLLCTHIISPLTKHSAYFVVYYAQYK